MNIDFSKLGQAVGAVVVLGIVILALTFIVPLLAGAFVIIGIIAVIYVVYQYLKKNGKI